MVGLLLAAWRTSARRRRVVGALTDLFKVSAVRKNGVVMAAAASSKSRNSRAL